MNKKELLKGNIAIAKAALKCGCVSYFGYPITPQTEIGEYLSFEMQKNNLAFVWNCYSYRPLEFNTNIIIQH